MGVPKIINFTENRHLIDFATVLLLYRKINPLKSRKSLFATSSNGNKTLSSGYSSNSSGQFSSSTSGVHEPVYIRPEIHEHTSPLSGGSSGPIRRTPRTSRASKISTNSDKYFTGCRKDGSFKSIDRNSSLKIRFQTELNLTLKGRENKSPVNSVDSGNSDSFSSNFNGCTNQVFEEEVSSKV